MNPEIVVVDYGMGNLGSVERALRKVGCEVIISSTPSLIQRAGGLVLPGVGSFRDCMVNLEKYGLTEPIKRFIFSGRPFLGICLGMQVLFTESEEFGHTPGLNILRGKVVHFPKGSGLKIPHMGWNKIRIKRRAPILKEIPDGSYLYFVHSYYVIPEDESVIATTTEYGIEFASNIWKDNIFACQFHPEKSQNIGLNILRRFKEVTRDAGQENSSLS
jgi:glutamine amidotransferase